MTNSFLHVFVRYLQSRTDCPAAFHVQAGMAALSIALGNRVWCDGWARPIYPNLWMVLIASSGFGKSVPLDMSEAIVRMAGLEIAFYPIRSARRPCTPRSAGSRAGSFTCRSSALLSARCNVSTTREQFPGSRRSTTFLMSTRGS